MMVDMKHSPSKFQESASAMLRNMTPLLAKARSLSFKKMLMPSVEVNRCSQQTELIKWQQEMFHRVLNTMCLVQEGLVDTCELEALRKQIIQSLISIHPNGEWADFTRDKLLFLQDLFQARCISEKDYHIAKQPLLSRLADQGAELDLQDFKFNSMELKTATESRIASMSTKLPQSPPQTEAKEIEVPADPTSAKKKTPIKHVMDAVSRLKSNTSKKLDISYFDERPAREEAKQSRVPHALDFIRPPDCPTREPPLTPTSEGSVESPLFKSARSWGARDLLPQLSSDTTDLLPQLSSLSLGETDSSPVNASACSTTRSPLLHSKSLAPSKLAFTPRSQLTPSKSSVGFNRSDSRKSALSSAPGGFAEKSLSRKLSGLLRGWQKPEPDRDSDDETAEHSEETGTPKKSVWKRLDLLSGSKWKHSVDDDDFGKEISDRDPLLSAIEDYPVEKVRSGFVHGQGPNVKKLKQKVAVKPAPTNFFIDQVLGDNIKTELDRIRGEMARTNPGNQTFTNDQIEAIATRLPVDKNELMRFFPKTWCDRYGDIVLEVVHKEFKCHVSEMDGLRKATKDKQTSQWRDRENDENRRTSDFQSSETQRPRPSPSGRASLKSPATKKVYTTEGCDFKGASVHEQNGCPPPRSPGARVRRGLCYEELDVKLGAEILRMPFRNFNEPPRF